VSDPGEDFNGTKRLRKEQCGLSQGFAREVDGDERKAEGVRKTKTKIPGQLDNFTLFPT
jgi:hypothetical protein